MKRFIFFLTLLIVSISFMGQPVFAREEKRNCFGMLWCTIETEDGVSVDALFYLYSSEQRGSYSKLAVRPFYSRESDPEEDYLRRSILWPLGTYERKGEHVSAHLLPLFWHGRSPGRRYTLILPFYLNDEKGDRADLYLLNYGRMESSELSRRYLFPIFGSETEKTLGESRLSLIGFPPISGLRSPPTLALYEHLNATDRIRDRLFPIYRYVRWIQEERTEIDALLLYRHDGSPQRVTDRLFPLYRYEHDLENHALHLAFIGHREISLFWYGADAEGKRHHLFPIYSYRNTMKGERRFGLIGHGRFSLFLKETTSTLSRQHLFPLYGYRKDLENGESHLNALLLYEHRSGPGGTTDRLIPFYHYENDLENQALRIAFIGHRKFSLLWYEANPETTRQHIFPVYNSRNTMGGEKHLGIFGAGRFTLFRHESSPTLNAHYLFPLYGYRSGESGYRFSFLGLPPAGDRMALSLYEHVSTDLMTSDRLFPLYRYANNRETGEIQWDVLLLYRHKETASFTQDTLLPIHSYENDRANGTWRFTLLGVSPLTLYEHRGGRNESADRFFPIYAYRFGPEGTRFSMLGFPNMGGGITFSLYEHTRTALRTTDRFFPIYSYVNNRETGEIRWDALLLYRHKKTEFYTKDVFLPVYSYENDRTKKFWRFGLFGVPPLMLIEHQVTAEETENRFFPLYGYRRTAEGRDFTMLGLPPSGGHLDLALIVDRRNSSGIRSRFFPFYRYERDYDALATRIALIGFRKFSLFWYNADPAMMRHHLFPLYSYRRDSNEGTSGLGLLGVGDFSLYRRSRNAGGFSDRLFPFYDYRVDGEEGSLSLFGVSNIALYRRERTSTYLSHRFFPIYRYRKDFASGGRRLNAMLLYEHRTGPRGTIDRFIPLYRYENDLENQALRVAFIGHREFSLFWYEADVDATRHHLFPVYNYRNTMEGVQRLGILGAGRFTLFLQESSPTLSTHRFAPVYGYREERDTGEWNLDILGISPLTLYRHRSGPGGTIDRLFPVYRYTSDVQAGTSRLNALGYREFSLYRHATSPTGIKDRIFPIYDYQHDREKAETRFNALLIARYRSSASQMKISLLPLFSYERDEVGDESRVGFLGVAPISLYQHLKTPELVSDRFFPIYNYSYDRSNQVGRLSILWPLFVRESLMGELTEFSILWWLVRYERPDEGHKEFQVLGGSAIALLRWKVTPELTRFEFNPLIPFYAYDSVQGRGTKWSFLGGLIGRETHEDGTTKMKWFWFL